MRAVHPTYPDVSKSWAANNNSVIQGRAKALQKALIDLGVNPNQVSIWHGKWHNTKNVTITIK